MAMNGGRSTIKIEISFMKNIPVVMKNGRNMITKAISFIENIPMTMQSMKIVKNLKTSMNTIIMEISFMKRIIF